MPKNGEFYMKFKFRFLGLTLSLILLVAACAPGTPEESADLTLPTPIVAATVPADLTGGLPAAPTMDANNIPRDIDAGETAVNPASTATPRPKSETPTYQVAYVTSDDTLNVRSGPGVDFGVVGELAPDAGGIRMSGSGQAVSASTWVPIKADGLDGWVNSRFLTETAVNFCEDEEVTQLLADLRAAIAEQDGRQLAQLIHPERGIRIHTAWWNPGVIITAEEIADLFSSSVSLDWGVEDGSGQTIVGPFRQTILPDLQKDLLPATETACDEILAGSTAGIVRLPDGYQQTHYVSFYRPAAEGDEFDWGTWVVGVDRWQGAYFISYLVHFQWEI